MKVGVTGASGYVGKKVVKELQNNSHEVFKFVRRSVKNEHEIYWSPSKQEIDIKKFEELDAIIHLAGESIAPKDLLGFLPFAGGRWSKERKSRIYWSRKWASDLFVSTFESAGNFPKIFITASGNDIYGDQGDKVVTEETTFNRGQFLQLVAEECWEEPLYQIKKLGVRVISARAGIMLGKGNVATDIFTLISKLNISSPIGKGTQYFSWVSVNDVAKAYNFCLEQNSMEGPVNITSPQPLMQKDFARTIAKIMNKAYFFPPVPEVLMKLAVGWELGESLGLNSIRAIPKKLLGAGFVFDFPTLDTMKKDFN
jgi:hypothetical protein